MQDDQKLPKCLNNLITESPKSKPIPFKDIVTRDTFQKEVNFIPEEWPKPQVQHGPCCGIYASSISMQYNGTSEMKIPPARKRDVEPDLKISKVEFSSIRAFCKSKGITEFGGIFDFKHFGQIFDYFKIANTEGLDLPTHDKGLPFTRAICEKLIKGNTIIIAADVKDEFPSTNKGEGAHWALIFGFIFLQKTCLFLVTQYNGYYLWTAESLFKSNKAMPITNPKAGIYIKSKSNAFTSSNYRKSPHFVDENARSQLPKNFFREVKETKLNSSFRFKGYAVPAPALKTTVSEFDSLSP